MFLLYQTILFVLHLGYNYYKVLKWILYALYERHLEREVRRSPLPKHVGIILDGNRRYAREMGFEDVSIGHKEGAKKLDELLKWCAELGIKVLTIWVLSQDNLRRDKAELDKLFNVIEEKIEDLSRNPVVKKYGYRIRIIGKREILPESLREVARRAEQATSSHSNYLLYVALGYGGREEIVEAVRKAIREKGVADVRTLADSLTAEDIALHLYTSEVPDPDLIIRTSGEIRLSGFLLWQSAYSEFYFCDALWPAFRKIDFLRAIRSYQQRNRRFGR